MPLSRLMAGAGKNLFFYSGRAPEWDELQAVNENRERILWVIKARWASLALLGFYGVFLRILYGSFADLSVAREREWMAVGAVAFVAAYNAWYHLTYRWWARVRIANVSQLLFDLVVITYLIHFSGGVHSWFWSVYVLVTLEATFLLDHKHEVWGVGACGALLYGALLTWEYYNVIPPIEMPFADASLQHDFTYEMVTWGWVAVMNAAVALIGTFLMGIVRERQDELQRLGVRDGLTGLYNRRYFFHRLQGEIERCRRYKRRLSVLLVDVDNFKLFNDRYGHLEGDHLLQSLARIFTGNIRHRETEPTYEVDIACRYGGEEFAVILPETEGDTGLNVAERLRERVILSAALSVAERIRDKVAGAEIRGRKITVSLGVSSFPTHGDHADALVRAADAALYAAKDRGKNCVVLADPPAKPPESFEVEPGLKQSPAGA